MIIKTILNIYKIFVQNSNKLEIDRIKILEQCAFWKKS